MAYCALRYSNYCNYDVSRISSLLGLKNSLNLSVVYHSAYNFPKNASQMTQEPISEAYFGPSNKIVLRDLRGSLTRLPSLTFHLLQQRPPKYLV